MVSYLALLNVSKHPSGERSFVIVDIFGIVVMYDGCDVSEILLSEIM